MRPRVLSRPIRRAARIDPTLWRWFMDEPEPEYEDGGDWFKRIELMGGFLHVGNRRVELHELWGEYGDEVLTAWLADRPGTRPNAWWKFDAPRWTDALAASHERQQLVEWIRRHHEEPRRRTGGTGDERWKCLNRAPEYLYGVPTGFVQAEDLKRFPGLVNGYDARPAAAFDPVDPPRFESQAHYLERHGLLLDAEEERLAPDDWTEDVVLSPGEPNPRCVERVLEAAL